MSAPAPMTDVSELTGRLRPLLPDWLAGRRWFAGKGQSAPLVEPVLVDVLHPGDPALLHLVVRTGRPGHEEWYQLLVGVARTAAAPAGAPVVGRATAPDGSGLLFYEATADPELMSRLLAHLAAEDADGLVECHRVPGADLPPGLPARVLTAEQSNTSVAFGDRLMLKVLRRLVPGPHPELELLTALQRAGDVPSARPLAWMQTSDAFPAGRTTLALLQEFVPSRGDGWSLATAEAARCITGECASVVPLGAFAAESRALGRATAEVHTALAQQLDSRELAVHEAAGLAAELTGRLESAVREVPALLPFARRLRELHQDVPGLVGRGHRLLVQRVHGDLHLGQVLRAPHGWVLIDFEGEPGHPLHERRRLQPAVRDVAAMLRSFDYAAHHALSEVLGGAPGGQGPRSGRPARRAAAWTVHNRRAFTAGYAEAGGPDPRCSPGLLRAFEADKAVYEAVYEARNRPDWLPIPLAAVRRLVDERPTAA
ncbi:maltokinase [Streptomyces sp. NPDC052701]|uniref:maltokinase N-terminal cap-like domain-containing protein n=1 Tax=Streptomyces sp. NPDC052701 TaxID=3155533 RepID=UPI00342A8A0C